MVGLRMGSIRSCVKGFNCHLFNLSKVPSCFPQKNTKVAKAQQLLQKAKEGSPGHHGNQETKLHHWSSQGRRNWVRQHWDKKACLWVFPKLRNPRWRKGKAKYWVKRAERMPKRDKLRRWRRKRSAVGSRQSVLKTEEDQAPGWSQRRHPNVSKFLKECNYLLLLTFYCVGLGLNQITRLYSDFFILNTKWWAILQKPQQFNIVWKSNL